MENHVVGALIESFRADLRLIAEQHLGIVQRLDGLERGQQVLSEAVALLSADVRIVKEDVRVLKEDVRVLKEDVRVLKEDVARLTDRTMRIEEHLGLPAPPSTKRRTTRRKH